MAHINPVAGPAARPHRTALTPDHPVVGGNHFEVLIDGVEMFPRMLQAIARSQRTIDIAQFSWKNDQVGKAFAEALIARARAGVRVRVTIDGVGSISHQPTMQRILKSMRAAGIDVRINWPLVDHGGDPHVNIDHRRLMVVDDREAYIGAAGFKKEYVREWPEVAVAMSGPVVAQAAAEFASTWRYGGGKAAPEDPQRLAMAAGGAVQARRGSPAGMRGEMVGSMPGGTDAIKRMYIAEIDKARRTLHATVPYFMNQHVIDALKRASARGVQVNVVVPSLRATNVPITTLILRSHYDELLKAGIRIFEHPQLAHGKAFVRDGEFATIGSANWDDWNFEQLIQLNVAVHDARFAQQVLDRKILPDMQKSHVVRPGEVSLFHRTAGRILRPLRDFL